MEDTEDRELGRFILQQRSWESLPTNFKKKLENSKEVWKERVVKYSVQHQLRWKTNLVRLMVPDERGYYQQVVKVSRSSFMVV